MIHDSIEFHNIAEMNPVEGVDGLRLQRVPEQVRSQLSAGTAGVMLSPSGGELRFRIDEGVDSVTVRLSSEQTAEVYVYFGPFQGPKLEVDTEPRDFKITPHKRILELMKVGCPDTDYHPGLVRLCFGDAYPEPILYHGHSEGISPPRPGDVPKKTYLAYGTSITHGTGLTGAALSYPAHVAWRLGYDLRNFGASGCCLCEKALADYMAEQPFDLATLALSVNMVASHSGAEFRERAGYLVEKVCDSQPDRPVACITIFPHFRDIDDAFVSADAKSTSEEFREILRDIVKGLARPNLSLIEGPELLDITGLRTDLIHPGARGQIMIAETLAAKLAALPVPAVVSA